MPSQSRYEALITVMDDGSIHLKASIKGFSASTRLSPVKALALREWLRSPDTEWERDPMSQPTLETIRFSHESGAILVQGLGYEKSFNPDNEESMIRLVRHLMRKAPLPVADGQQKLPGVLPEVTEEDLAKRTVLAEVASASGIKAYKKPKPRYNQPTASQIRSMELIESALGNLLHKGIK